MKWLTNTYDPNLEDAKFKVARKVDESIEDTWQNQVVWLADKTIGLPRATEFYSVAQFIKMNLVGIYSKEN